MIFDLIFEELYLKTSKGEWTSIDELNKAFRSYGFEEDNLRDIMSFFSEYFIELKDKKVKLNNCFFNLFQSLNQDNL
jgi:hypothetical protein